MDNIIQELLNNFEIEEKELYGCVPLHSPFQKQTIPLKNTMKKGDIINLLEKSDILLFSKSVLSKYTLTQQDIDECITISKTTDVVVSKPIEDLSVYSVATLKILCKNKKMPTSGNKTELIQRLSGNGVITKKSKKTINKSYLTHFVRPEICIRRNTHGRYEQFETGFVFDPISQLVIGKEKDGECKPLNTDDIELCKEKKLSWKVPLNLDI